MIGIFNIFRFAICENKFEMAEFLIHQPFINEINHFSVTNVPTPILKEKNSPNCFSDLDEPLDYEPRYILNFIQFFLNNSSDSKVEEIKKEIIRKIDALAACYAAFILDEKKLELFFKKYNLNINLTEEYTKMTPLLTSILNKNQNILKHILTEYKLCLFWDLFYDDY